jgi:hypothetical protein
VTGQPDPDLLGYLLHTLEPHELRAVEAYVHAHPEAQVRLEGLKHALEPLSWDPAEAPPADLASRTIAQIGPVEVAAASTAANAAIRGFRPSRRFVEMFVAVAAAAVAAGIVTSWVGQIHHDTPDAPNPLHLIECKYNLQKIYTSGLRPYCDIHSGHFPSVANATERSERNIAGLVYPILYDSKFLSPDVSVRCPGAVGLGVSPYGLDEIKRMNKESFECWANHLHHSYAYTLGYKSGVKGQVVGLRLEEGKPSSQMPLMADSAPLDPKIGNSPHHGGHGQNVLYCDGHIVFCPNRNAGYEKDDIYLNRAGKVAAGLDWTDTVLSSSLAPP